MIHVTAGFCLQDIQNFPSKYSLFFTCFLNVVSRFAVPIFFMLSGMLLLADRADGSLKTVYTKRIPRILLPLIAWNIFYALLDVAYYIYKGKFDFSVFYNFVNNVLFGHFHLWFLYVLVGIYAVIPILKLVIKDKKATLYLCGIIAGLSFLRNTLASLADSAVVQNFLQVESGSYFLQMAGKICRWGINQLIRISDSLHIELFSTYVLAFLLGYVLSTISLSKKQRAFLYLTGMVSLIIMTGGTFFRALRGSSYGFWLSPSQIPAIIMAVAVFVYVQETLRLASIAPFFQKIITFTAQYSLGIYLIHVFFITMYNIFLPIRSISYPVLTFMLYAGGVFLASLAASWLIGRIPFLRKLVM